LLGHRMRCLVRTAVLHMPSSSTFCILLAFAVVAIHAASDSDSFHRLSEFLPLTQTGPACSDCDWTAVEDVGVRGRALFPSFPQRESYYDRLPLAAKNEVRPAVWTLSTMSAGMYCEFITSSPSIYLNVSYTSPELSMYKQQFPLPLFY
jgi:hypothetical protein